VGLPVFRGRILGGGPPPRFLLHVAAVVAVLIVILVVRPGLGHDGGVGQPGPVVSTVDTGSQHTHEHEHQDEGGVYVPTLRASARVDAADVATRFAAAWARPGLAPDVWWHDVARYAEPGYARLLRTVDPANVPATRVIGTARVVTTEAGLVVLDVPTDTGLCRVTVADASGTGEWKVSTHSWIPGAGS
jgi:hypothetical protein